MVPLFLVWFRVIFHTETSHDQFCLKLHHFVDDYVVVDFVDVVDGLDLVSEMGTENILECCCWFEIAGQVLQS